MKREEIIRLMLLVADDLEERNYPATGIIRAAAKELARTKKPLDLPTGTLACPRCGLPVIQPATGRRRRWCSEVCRRNSRNAKVAS